MLPCFTEKHWEQSPFKSLTLYNAKFELMVIFKFIFQTRLNASESISLINYICGALTFFEKWKRLNSGGEPKGFCGGSNYLDRVRDTNRFCIGG